jgi:hypothetical protein
MFPYFGSKFRLAKKYPKPEFSTIIEPFAGSAQYSLRYWENDVILVDAYDVIINLWKWLQGCTEKDILGIRQMKLGECVDDFSWDCKEQKDLVGFIISAAPESPRRMPTRWRTIDRPESQGKRLKYIAENLYKIRHWKFVQGSYLLSPDIKATWFIDPPYQVAGKNYKVGNNLDYKALAFWIETRLGQKIVCESLGANWMPFKSKLGEIVGLRKKTTEVVLHISGKERQDIFSW